MIAKIVKGSNFKGIVNYILDKEKDAKILVCDGLFAENKETIVSSFEAQARMNPRVTKPVGHIALAFSKEDEHRLTDRVMAGIALEYKVTFDRILLSQKRLSYILRNKKMKLAVFGSDKSSTPLLLANLNEFMRSNGFPTFEVIRRMTRIQDNGKLTEYSPWNDKNLVFVPAGKLGVIKNAYADNELRQEPGVTYSNYGRIRISQWGKGETDNSNGVEFTKAQSLSLPVITEINGIYSLTVES